MIPAPPVPPPVSAAPSAPRLVWAAHKPAHMRLLARDWDDGHPATYTVEALHGRHWQPATGEEAWACFLALAACVDDATREEEQA